MFLNRKSFLVLGLRGFTLLAKLGFTIILARLLSVIEFGQWVLIVAIVTYGIFVVGAEVYNLTLRNYIARGHAAVIPAFSAQWTYYAVAYALIAGIGASLSLVGGGALAQVAWLIALILILEHATQELHRLAFFSDHQVHANAILLIKSAGWMFPMGAYLAYLPARANLETVLLGWLIGAAASALYAFACYRHIFHGLAASHLQGYLQRWRATGRRLAPFLVIAVALRTPLLLDRYMIEHFAGSAALGAYGYYATFGNGVQAIFDAVMLARLTPRLLNQTEQPDDQRRTLRYFMRQSTGFWLISLLGLYLTIPYVNTFVGKESFQDAFSLLLLLSFGQMVNSLAAVLHYGLYAMHRDRQLTIGALVYLGLSLLFYVALIPPFGSYGAAIALILSSTGLLLCRVIQLGDRAVAT